MNKLARIGRWLVSDDGIDSLIALALLAVIAFSLIYFGGLS